MIATPRLVLRRLMMSDQDAIDALLGDEEVMADSETGPWNAKQAAAWLREHLDSYKENNGIEVLAVEMKSTSEFIGYCGLTSNPDIDGVTEIEVGYRLVRKCWGNGYASEAASAVRDYTFAELKLPRLVAFIAPGNTRSINVAKKLGMNYEKDWLMEDQNYPDRVYSMANPGQSR